MSNQQKEEHDNNESACHLRLTAACATYLDQCTKEKTTLIFEYTSSATAREIESISKVSLVSHLQSSEAYDARTDTDDGASENYKREKNRFPCKRSTYTRPAKTDEAKG